MTVKVGGDSYENPLPGHTYLSPSLADFTTPERKIRIATKAIDSDEQLAFATVKGELVLRQTAGGRTRITAKFFEDDRGVFSLNVQAYTNATLNPNKTSFTFRGEEIDKLVEFINHIQLMPIKNSGSRRIRDSELQRLVLSSSEARTLLRNNPEVFREVVRQELTREDVVAVAYRKKQLLVFEQLLEDADYFAQKKVQYGCGDEKLWQIFFEKNPWIFGYGLSYLYLSGLTDQKLEQYVSGYRVFKQGKRADAVMRTRGVLSNLCFIEIKTHRTALLQASAYRAECWAPSDELAGAVSQVQGTVAAAALEIRQKLSGRTEQGEPTGEESYNYAPKAFLIAGSLGQFVTERGVNEERHRSFELLRRNTILPEIITFDELYERARFIVQKDDTRKDEPKE